jgi:phosphopantothenoylcysteine decarboxylase/phosphopantothenate--cysteine ligase
LGFDQMGRLSGKKILIGVTGSIAAYKSLILLRLLQKEGAEIKLIMTDAAKDFVGELSFSTLTDTAVYSDLFKNNEWSNHVELGLWADLFVIAPATANTIAKMAHGIVDNLLTAVYLSAKCPVLVAPAMDLDMWKHPATINNIHTIESYGNQIVPVGDGHLASGLTGPGRLAEPDDILNSICAYLSNSNKLQNTKILITAGPTYEAIDPVRFIGNRSSGKMGIRIAEEAAMQGANVVLILGPSNEAIKDLANLKIKRVESADQMYDEAMAHVTDTKIFILAAAVADYKVTNPSSEKIKKSDDTLSLELNKTKDIAANIGKVKRQDQILVGFALETENLLENAKTKLHKKNMDFIVMNSPKIQNTAFGFDTNKISILFSNGNIKEFELKAKSEVAKDIINEIIQITNNEIQ